MIHEKRWTDKQRGAMHVWCRQCEAWLNEKEIPRYDAVTGKKRRWREGDFKYYIYKVFLNARYGKKSTEDQNTIEPGEICLALSSHCLTEFGWQLPEWPSYGYHHPRRESANHSTR